MARRRYLSKRQIEVLDDMFKGELDEQGVLLKHRVSRVTYNKWQADGLFRDEFERRLRSAGRQSEVIIARYSGVATAKLVELTESASQETARKACLDIIGLLRRREPALQNQDADNSSAQPAELPPELASRLLAALAEEVK